MSLARMMQMAAAGVSAAGGPFVGSASGFSNTSGQPATIDMSGLSIQADDFAVVFSGSTNTGVTIGITSGWTELITIKGNDTRDGRVAVGYKVLDGTETSVSIGPNDNGNGITAIVMVFRGIDTSNPFDVAETTSTTINTNDGVSPAITPTNDAVIVCVEGASSEADSGSVTVTNNDLDAVFYQGVNTGTLASFAAGGYVILQSGGAAFGATTFTASGVTVLIRQSVGLVTMALRISAATPPAGWTDPDLANASYDSVSFSVAGQEATPTGMLFKPDGLKMYIIGNSGDGVDEYNLSTAWDLSTASFLQSFSVAAQETFSSDIFFKPDGTKMYVTGTSGDDVNEYNLSAAWDVSTASFLRNSSVAGQDANPQGLFFKPDGTKMYVVGSTGDSVYEYNLNTAWDISTISYLQNFSVATQETQPQGVFFNPNGTKLYIIGQAGDDVNEYNLSAAWDVSTASYLQNFSVAGQETAPTALFFKSDGSKMYVVGSANDTIYQYSTV